MWTTEKTEQKPVKDVEEPIEKIPPEVMESLKETVQQDTTPAEEFVPTEWEVEKPAQYQEEKPEDIQEAQPAPWDIPSAPAPVFLPCPHCGGEANVDIIHTYPSDNFRVKCKDCGASGPITAVRCEAVHAWNRRTA